MPQGMFWDFIFRIFPMVKLRKSFAVFSIGFFAIASQTLLFREFISAFESNDIAVGVFFGSWFLWISLAAWISVKFGNYFAKFADWTPLIILSYLPAFIIQYLLILNIRKCAGVEVYELFPIWKMIFWSLAANAPLSFVTGFVFPMACKWFREAGKLPVADVYVFESLGSFAGGLAVTLMLVAGFNTFLVFLVTALILASSFCFLKSRNYVGMVLPLILVFCIAFRIDVKLIESVRLLKWTKMLPAEAYEGAFQTAQAEYLYGSCNGQWTVCREGSACETMPDPENAWKIIAVHLAQNPRAEKILVIGSGMNLCRELLRIPQITELTWTHYDNGYVSELNKYVPEKLRIADRRFHPLEKGDIRGLLAKRKNHYDIVIVNVPDVTSSILNRYFTMEFNELVKSSISANGLLGIRLGGGENVIGPELAFIGASALTTLGKTFPHVEIVPGDTSWLLVSASPDLTGDPEILVRRFSSIKKASAFFPPEGLMSLYIPDRAEMALEKYKSVKVPGTTLLNTDANPPAYLFGLLLSARQSGAGLTNFVEKLLGKGVFFPAVPLGLFLLLLAVYVFRNRGERRIQGRILSLWVIFGAGFVSMGTVIVLMYLFQTCLGSLYLNVGVVSAVFMLGLSLGAALAGHLFERAKIESGLLLDLSVTLHVTVLFLILYLRMSEWTYAYFIMAFAFSGICSGLYFPAAAFFLRESGRDELGAGGMLETSDHLGAALGAFICGVLIIPVWGASGTLIFFMIFIMTIIPVSLICRHGRSPDGEDAPALKYRNAGYFLFGTAAAVVIWSNMLSISAGEPIRLLPARGSIYLFGIFVAALIVSFKGGFKSRLGVLLHTLFIGGIILGVQYSTAEIITLLSFKTSFSFGLSAFLAVLVPLIAVFAGNYYCGYVCPFGALQEIASYILPGRFKPLLNDRAMLAGRQVKYLLFFTIIVLYFLSWDKKIMDWDPLICFFSGRINSAAMAAAGIALIGSLLYFRFWCRYLCTAGAFLSLMGTICLLRRYMPVKIFKNCEMGVRSMREMDCIYCDRCRPEFKPKTGCCGVLTGGTVFSRLLTRMFIYIVLAAGLLLAGYSAREFYNSSKRGAENPPETKQLQLMPAEKKTAKPTPDTGVEMKPGVPRDVNMEKLNKMIKSGKLSDREAEFYRKIE